MAEDIIGQSKVGPDDGQPTAARRLMQMILLERQRHAELSRERYRRGFVSGFALGLVIVVGIGLIIAVW